MRASFLFKYKHFLLVCISAVLLCLVLPHTAWAFGVTKHYIASEVEIPYSQNVVINSSENPFSASKVTVSGTGGNWRWGVIPNDSSFLAGRTGLYYSKGTSAPLESIHEKFTGTITMRFRKAAMYSDGRDLDIEVKVTNIEIETTSNYSRSICSIFGLNGNSIYTGADSGRCGVRFDMTFTYYYSDTGARCDGTYWMCVSDIDVWHNVGDSGDKYYESLYINNYCDPNVFLFNDTLLAVSESGSWCRFMNSSHDAHDDNDRRTSVIVGIKSGGTIRWSGAACGTRLFKSISPYEITSYKHGTGAGTITARPGTRPTDANGSTLEWGFRNTPTYTATPNAWSKITSVETRPYSGTWTQRSGATYNAFSYTYPQLTQNMDFRATFAPLLGKISVNKLSDKSAWVDQLATYTLSGAQFGVYDWWDDIAQNRTVDTLAWPSKKTTKDLPTTSRYSSDQNNADRKYYYYVKETKAPAGHKASTVVPLVYVWDGSNNTATITNTAVFASPEYLMTKLESELGGNNPQGDGSFAGCVWRLQYYDSYTTNPAALSAKTIASWTTDAQGRIHFTDAPSSGNWPWKDGTRNVCPLGTYVLTETTGNDSYDKTNETFMFQVTQPTSGGDAVITRLGTTWQNDGWYGTQGNIHRGILEIDKVDADTGRAEAQGDGTFEGITFAVFNASARSVIYNGATYAPNERVCTVAVNANGHAEVSGLAYGTYRVTEISAADSGYLRNTSWSQTVAVHPTTNGQRFAVAEKCRDSVIRGTMSGMIVDADWNTGDHQGDGSLAGAVMQIVNASAKSVVVGGREYAPGAVIGTVETAADGTYSFGDLPYGTYTVSQVAAPEAGYLVNDTWRETFSIRENGKNVALKTVCANEVIRGNTQAAKLDADTGVAQGDATFAGISFTYKLISDAPVYWKGQTYQPGQIVASEAVSATSGLALVNELPYATYEVREKVDANSVYHLNADWKAVLTIREDGYTVDIGTLPCEDKITRGGIKLQKVDADTLKPVPSGNGTLKGAVFAIYNASAAPVKVNGQMWPSVAGVPLEKLDSRTPMFTMVTDVNGRASTATDTLPYGTYIIREIQAPEGYKLNEEFALGVRFTIREEAGYVDFSKIVTEKK